MECMKSNVRSHQSNKMSADCCCENHKLKNEELYNKYTGADISPYSIGAIRIANTTSFGNF
jgi:hypothetical protein